MSRRRFAAVMVAVLAGIGIAFAVLELIRSLSDGAKPLEPGRGTLVAGQLTGQHGGALLKSGDFALEVMLSESPDNARLVVYPYVKGQPAEGRTAISGTLTRVQGNTENLQFVPSGNAFESTQTIVKPHVFDATLHMSWRGQTTSFRYARSDGAIALSPEQIRAARIELAVAAPATVTATLQMPGEIRFNEDRTAHVVPRVPGIVERVAVSIGEQVRKGQLLAVIASSDLADRRSELRTAERRLSSARTTYQREKTLWQERISAEQDYLQAQTQLVEAEIAAQNARQKLQALSAPANGERLNRYELRAPLDGTIVEKHATAGESIAADTKIFTISDLSTVWAEMAVTAQQLDVVRVGRQATVKATAFDMSSSGRVAYIGALLGEQTRSAPARVVLANPEGVWRPGMFVNVVVNAGQQPVAVAVPQDAIHEIDGSPSVFVASSKGFVTNPVKTGRKDDRVVEIESGLNPGQRYVAANGFVLKAELGKGNAEE